LAIRKLAGSRPASASACRTVGTCSANCAVVDDPAPKKPLPCLTARRNASGWLAPNQIGGWGFWNGLGSIAASFNCQNRPSKLTRSSVQRAFISRSPSLNRATRLVGSTWKAENMRPRPPVPTPISSRPRLN
jgi:hypothetical protein